MHRQTGIMMQLKPAMGWDSQVPMRSGSGGAQYIDIALTDGRRSSSSPPRYRQSVLTRLHEVRHGAPACRAGMLTSPRQPGPQLQDSLFRTLPRWSVSSLRATRS